MQRKSGRRVRGSFSTVALPKTVIYRPQRSPDEKSRALPDRYRAGTERRFEVMTEAPRKDASRLELIDVSKRFPGVLANDQVSLTVKSGEIHALLGENGAGKSTLVKMIYGIQSPDSGTIRWEGQDVRVANPRAARRLGIGMVFQHFSLFEAMDVLENIALGLDNAVSRKELDSEIRSVMTRYGLNLDPRRQVSTLSVGERQRIEIVRALLLNPRLLIMDEPTSVLTPQEVGELFKTLRRLASEGCSVLYISHKLHEIVELCDVATILRGGRVVATCDPKRETPRSMGEMMIGSDLRDPARSQSNLVGPVRLRVDGLSLPKPDDFGVALNQIKMDVKGGEIYGIAGVAGNGQNELLEALCGERLADIEDTITVDQNPVGRLGPTERRALGLCAVPEERNGHAAIGAFSLADNAILTARSRMGLENGGFIHHDAATSFSANVIKTFAVKALGPKALAGSLSGGNLQKFVMGREIMQNPGVLVVSQPTWGVDAGSAAFIHQALIDLASKGSAIVVISQDLDELLRLCDRLSVINLGQLSPPRPVGEVSIQELGLLMGGHNGRPAQEAGGIHALDA
jgi:general nucleoside transport system ATP-binding protein